MGKAKIYQLNLNYSQEMGFSVIKDDNLILESICISHWIFFFLDDRENIIVQQKTSVLHKTISSLCKRHLKEWFRIIKNYQTRTNWLKQYLMCKGQVRVQPSTLATIVLKINFLDFHLTIEPNFKVYDKCWNDQCKCSIFFLCLKIN